MTKEKKWQKHLEESKKHFQNSTHIIHIGVRLLKENRLLAKSLNELHKSCVELIKAFLEYEVEKNKIKLYKKPIDNLNLFLNKIAPKYLTEQEIDSMIKILQLARKHKDAPLEFVKKEKLIIFNHDNFEVISLDILKDLSKNVGSVMGRFSVMTRKKPNFA